MEKDKEQKDCVSFLQEKLAEQKDKTLEAEKLNKKNEHKIKDLNVEI